MGLAAILIAIVHLLAGGAIGFFFKVTMLIIVSGISLVAIIVVCHATETALWTILIASELALQAGYVVGSTVSAFRQP